MSDLAQWPEADALLDEALGLEPDERERWLQQLAARDADLARAIGTLLRDGLDDGFLPSGGAARLLADFVASGVPHDADEPPGLTPGVRFGPYRIDSLLGRGGMGEVYRARDLRLERDVALKVLPARWTTHAERRARFEREARLLGSLRHVGIASLHHLEEHDGVMALVLELVEGPTLEERLRAGPLPVPQVIALARALVDALDAAHQRGIVHRDLKPANIKLPPGGGARVLDFGLARAIATADGQDGTGLTSRHGVAARLLGTPAYMSPEQARGDRVDARSDIWAFGCVLFECLTGQHAFEGATTADVLARVAEDEPDYSRMPGGVPDALRRLVRRCLQKDPRMRLGYIGDALSDLDDAERLPGSSPRPVVRTLASPWTWGLAATVLATLLAAGGYVRFAARADRAPTKLRLAVPLPPGDRFVPSHVPVLAVAPDDGAVVYRAQRNGVTQLYLRPLDAAEAIPLAGTENATGPFFSPDGRWLAFDRDGVLTRVMRAGGPPLPVCPAPGGLSGTWTDDGRIVFAAGTARVLQVVRAEDGPPDAVTRLTTDAGEVSHGTPMHVPGTRWVLFTVYTTGQSFLSRLDLASREVVRLVEGKQPQYLASGHVAFMRNGAIWVAPFDAASGTFTGEAQPAVADVLDGAASTSGGQFASNASGTLVYAPRQEAVSTRALLWLGRTGHATELPIELRAITRAAVSPDGRRIALAIAEPGGQDVWIHDVAREGLQRLTTDRGIETAPVWMPDGRALVYRSDRDGGGLFLHELAGGRIRRLTRPDGPIHTPYDVTADGRFVLFTEFRSYKDQDVAMVNVTTGAVTRLVAEKAAEVRPQLSRDGRWLAYQSDDSGRFEVYVRPFPAVQTTRWQVSSGGGTSPVWSPDGRELLYDDGKGVRGVGVAAGESFRAGTPVLLFEAPGIMRDRMGPILDVHPDGRLLSISGTRGTPAPPSPLMIARGWLPAFGATRGR